MNVLCVLLTSNRDSSRETERSICNQTIPVKLIINDKPYNRIENETFPHFISRILNDTLLNTDLSMYDYLLRVDDDCLLPSTWIERNLGFDLVSSSGQAQLIKMAPFLELMNGRFYEDQDDSYLAYKFLINNKSFSEWLYPPISLRKTGEKHDNSYWINRGKIMYQQGFEPLHILFLHKNKKHFYEVYSFLKCYITRPKRFDTASYVFHEQMKGYLKRIRHPVFTARNLYKKYIIKKESSSWKYYPDVLQFDLTNRCNLKCIYCNKQYFCIKQGELLFSDYVKVLDEAGKYAREVRLFLNGEPMLDDRLPVFINYCYNFPNLKVIVYSNGSLYEKRELLHNNVLDEIHFTISAATPRTYERVHGKPLFEDAGKTVFWLQKNKYPHQKIFVHFVITKQNIEEIRGWRKLFEGFNQIVSPLHKSFEQLSSLKCLDDLEGIDTLQYSTLKGRIFDMPCTCFNNFSIGSGGQFLQCCSASFNFNYGKVGEKHTLLAWRERLDNQLENPVCQSCNLKAKNYKMFFKKKG